MKTGCAIWCSNTSSLPEIVGNKYPYLFDPNDWGSALKSFSKIFNDDLAVVKKKLKNQMNLAGLKALKIH